MLEICDSARSYKFRIWFDSDENGITNLIASLLKFPTIEHCTNLEIKIASLCGEQNLLPIKPILNWLKKSVDGMGINYRKQNEKFLGIWMNGIYNAREMIDHMKMVYLIDFLNIYIMQLINFNKLLSCCQLIR